MASRAVIAARRLVSNAPLRDASALRAFATSSQHGVASPSSSTSNTSPFAAQTSSPAPPRRPFPSLRAQVPQAEPAAPSPSAVEVTQTEDATAEASESEEQFEIPQCLLPTEKLPYTHKHHVATLHLRCYTSEVQEMDRFADFCRKAAYAIGIPSGNIERLPTRTRLWTVLKGPFVHKKAQENFWRRTHSRIMRLYDANPEVVDRWLLFLRIHAAPGIGMKAELFRHHAPGVGTRMTKELEAKQLSIAERVGSPSPSPKAKEQATSAQTADQIKEIARGIVQDEMDKIDSEEKSSDPAQTGSVETAENEAAPVEAAEDAPVDAAEDALVEAAENAPAETAENKADSTETASTDKPQ